MEEAKPTLYNRFTNWLNGDVVSDKPVIKASHRVGSGLRHVGSFAFSYDGEKNLGGIGPIKDYHLAYYILNTRSWQSYLESEISQTVLKRFSDWVIGGGLKLQSEPSKNVLESENISIGKDFIENVEARFSVYQRSKFSSFTGMKNLDKLAYDCHKNAIIGGDVLVILRLVKKQLKVQLIDGAHVQSPGFGNDFFKQAKKDGNVIRNGVELNSKGQHVAYHIRESGFTFKRIPSKSRKTGLTTAFLVYGSEYRLDDHRGIPLIASVMETLAKLERYKEATVGSAEERQKIAFSIEHDSQSTGENPLLERLSYAFDTSGQQNEQLPEDINTTQLANNVAASTEKTVVNMPVGAKLKQLVSDNELSFKDFYTTNINIICPAIGMPPEIAFSKYDSNFSASRAALKDWEHTLNIKRKEFSFQFYQPIYDFWLYFQVLTGKIQADGYLNAFNSDDEMIISAYDRSRWVGATVPHIDPVKEVAAERAKLGDAFKDTPLTTPSASTEALNGGDFHANLEVAGKELEDSKKAIIVEVPEVKPIPTDPKKS